MIPLHLPQVHALFLFNIAIAITTLVKERYNRTNEKGSEVIESLQPHMTDCQTDAKGPLRRESHGLQRNKGHWGRGRGKGGWRGEEGAKRKRREHKHDREAGSGFFYGEWNERRVQIQVC